MIPIDKSIITESITLKSGSYFLPNGIKIKGKNIILDGSGSFIFGSQYSGYGIDISESENVTIRNMVIQNYFHGIHAYNAKNLTISNCVISSTHEIPSNTQFLDIWISKDNAYGAGIFLSDIVGGNVVGNNLSHQMNGLSMYDCDHIEVTGNIANYCSGWGFHLNKSSHCLFENNYADYCCRYEPRGVRIGHMGADSAGFLIINHSSNNTFLKNYARLGGDGFFLAGLSPEYEPVPCNDNLFESNDASYSPNNAFESTFNAGNIFRDNYANYSNYGFWLGFSSDNIIENNQIVGNRRAGIATENGVNFTVTNNSISLNQYGILLWSKRIPQFENILPENVTSKHWKIENNYFIKNNIVVRIAADQDHGIRPLQSDGSLGLPAPKPEDHFIKNNKFQDNNDILEEIDTIDTVLE